MRSAAAHACSGPVICKSSHQCVLWPTSTLVCRTIQPGEMISPTMLLLPVREIPQEASTSGAAHGSKPAVHRKDDASGAATQQGAAGASQVSLSNACTCTGLECCRCICVCVLEVYESKRRVFRVITNSGMFAWQADGTATGADGDLQNQHPRRCKGFACRGGVAACGGNSQVVHDTCRPTGITEPTASSVRTCARCCLADGQRRRTASNESHKATLRLRWWRRRRRAASCEGVVA